MGSYYYIQIYNKVHEGKCNENIRNEDNTSGLADDEMMTDVTKSAHGLWRVISAFSEYLARHE